MTTRTAAVSLDALDTAIAAATGQLGEDEQRLAVAVFRLLSAGHPVSVPAAADAAGMPAPPAETMATAGAVAWAGLGLALGIGLAAAMLFVVALAHVLGGPPGGGARADWGRTDHAV